MEDETTSNGRINSINNEIDEDFTVGDVNDDNSDDVITIKDISVEDVEQSELNFDLKDIDVNILHDFSNVVYGMINDEIENGGSYDEYSIFKYVCNFDSLVSDIIVPETNRYAQQKGIEFMTEVTALVS